MAENECWIAAELTPEGDASEVIETVSEGTPYRFQGKEEDEAVVLHGRTSSFGNVKEPLQTVADHLDRLVFVGSAEGGEGTTRSTYFADAGDLDDPTDRLESDLGRWWVGHHFDYYAAKYDVHVPV